MEKEMRLSIAIATYNEASVIGRCLMSVVDIADEIVVVDGGSTDKTAEIASRLNAKVIQTDNPKIFHINKQKALDHCRGKWILQLDADEEVSKELKKEIVSILESSDAEIQNRQIHGKKKQLFLRHEQLIAARDGIVGTDEKIVAGFYVPRLTYFLGGAIRYAGTYPDGVIRLVRNGYAKFPCRSVHEQIKISGQVRWLEHDLYHYSNPTVAKYWKSADRYIRLKSDEMTRDHLQTSIPYLMRYMFFEPLFAFFRLYIRHKGILDGWRGFVFCLFSSLHYPMAYWIYYRS